MSIGFFRRQRAGDVARPDAAPRARAVPDRRALGRARPARRRHAAGTGDVSISLGQLLPRAEVVVVTTPQPAAKEVASRAAVMAQKTNMRLIGAIENMTGDVLGRRRRGRACGGARGTAPRRDPARSPAARAGRPRHPSRLGRAELADRARDRRARGGDRRHAPRRGRRHREGAARLPERRRVLRSRPTLPRRSSTLALAPAFRRHGVITRVQVAKAAFWQLLFVARGASQERARSLGGGADAPTGLLAGADARARRGGARARAPAARLPRAPRSGRAPPRAR